MRKRAIRYTKAYIDRAVRLCDESDHTISAVARDLGIRYQTLYEWMRKAGKTKRRTDVGGLQTVADDGPVTGTPEAMQAEIARLQRELEETKKQLEFAKKAAAFFAQQSK
jgi:transposase